MSKIEVNTVDVASGSTLTLGSSGKTITIPAGATISNAGTSSGFGGSGAVSWDTTPKTSTFTGATGIGYFVNTSGGAVTLNLPAGSAGNIIAVSDYARNFDTANLTINPNGSEKIGGVAQDLILSVKGQALTLIYVDGTNGWINIQNAEDTETGTPPFMCASGGTITNTPTCRIHTFTGSGSFVVNSLSPAPANNAVAYMVVGGGGGGGDGGTGEAGGGAGAGGFREYLTSPITPYTASPQASTTGITVSVQSYPVTIGAGGAVIGTGPTSGNCATNSGSVSSGLSYTSAGGGGSSSGGGSASGAKTGGSGGGGNGRGHPAGVAGNTPPVSPPQGNNGGNGQPSPGNKGGGGGGASAVGGNASSPGTTGGVGGAGATTSINNSATTFAGGGGGGNQGGSSPVGGAGGAGGGGDGKKGGPGGVNGDSGTTNTGGGGGGTSCGQHGGRGGAGGSGIVIIRYKIA